jgi:hypothetical protein
MLPDSMALILPNYASDSVEAADLASLRRSRLSALTALGIVVGVLSRAGVRHHGNVVSLSRPVAPEGAFGS